MVGRDHDAVVPEGSTRANPQSLSAWARRLGLKHLLRPGLTPYQRMQALRLSLIPIDFWRYAEIPFVIDRLPGEVTRVLDIASPRILSAFIAKFHQIDVMVCDVQPRHGEELAIYQSETDRLGGVSASATNLPYRDESIPFVSSVSVIEHIGDDGDIQAMREIARVLEPGGLAAITVPIANQYEEIWHQVDTFGAQTHDERGVFFCRVYDPSAITNRLCAESALEPIERKAVFADDPIWLARYQRRTASPRSPIAIATKLFDHHWARRRLRLQEFDAPWPNGRGVALLLFRKRA